MKQLVIIRIFSDMSLVFALCYYLLSFIGEIELYGIIYLTISITTFAAYELRKSSKRNIYAFSVLLLANFAAAKTMADLIFVAVAVFYSAYFLFKGLGETGYFLAVDRFNKGLVAIASMFAISIPTHSLHIVEAKSVPFIIIFLITSVMLTRSLRLRQYNENTDELNKINLRYSVIVVGLSALLSIRQVRQFITGTLLMIYDFLLEAIIIVMYGAFLAVGYVLKYIIAFVRSLLEGKKIERRTDIQGSLFENIEDINTESLIESINRSYIFNIIVKVALTLMVLLAVYYIVKMLMRSLHDRREEEEYTETKEFIKRDEGRSRPRRWAALLKPKSYSEYIRYYYQKFLRLCLDRKVDIRNSDTTLQISRKSMKAFDTETVENMRDTYIKVRYGGDEGDKLTARGFYKYYKQLKK